MNILVLESSTSSAKALVFNSEKGNVRASSSAYPSGISDHATQNADGVVKAVLELGQEAAQGIKIDAIALCGAWHSLLVCDRDMRPRTPVYSWQYMGARKTVGRLLRDKAAVEQLYRDTGCMAHSIYPVYKLAHLREEGLDTGAVRVCGQGSYLFYRLTGQWKTTACMASGSAFLNIHTKKYNEMSLKLAGISAGQLGELCASFEHAPLNREAAGALGVSAGIPVLAANADGALNQVGSLAAAGDMTVSIGTSAALRLNAASPDIHDNARGTWLYLSPYSWMIGAATSGACNCVDWFMRELSGGQSSYNELAERKTDFENLPYFMPFLYGERCPGWDDAKPGGFRGILAGHTTAELYQSVLEGVLFNVYQCYLEICAVAGEPKRIMLSGGILHSPQWLQMAADIFGRELTKDNAAQASLVGAAYLALDALKGVRIKDCAEREAIRPRMERVPIYRARYRRYLEHYVNGE